MKLIKFFGMTIYWVVLALISFYVYSLDYNHINIENWTDFQKIIFAMAWLFKSIFTIIFILFFVNRKNKDLWCFCILILYLIIFPALLIYMFSKEEILSYIKFIYIIIDIILFSVGFLFLSDSRWAKYFKYSIKRRELLFLIFFIIIFTNIIGGTLMILWSNNFKNYSWWNLFLFFLSNGLFQNIEWQEASRVTIIFILVINSGLYFIVGLLFTQSIIFTFNNRNKIFFDHTVKLYKKKPNYSKATEHIKIIIWSDSESKLNQSFKTQLFQCFGINNVCQFEEKIYLRRKSKTTFLEEIHSFEFSLEIIINEMKLDFENIMMINRNSFNRNNNKEDSDLEYEIYK